MPSPVHFASEPRMIGRHEWRVIVTDSRFRAGGRVTDYEFRRIGDLPIWQNCREWPSYDADNGTTAGLPLTLARLYEANVADIKAALASQESIAALLWA